MRVKICMKILWLLGEVNGTHRLNRVLGPFALTSLGVGAIIGTGESGTGKEVFAKLIHYMSKKKNNFFGAINCSAICDSLMESEFSGGGLSGMS